MPTASRIIGALALALVCFGTADIVLFHSIAIQNDGGLNPYMFAFVGAIVGWRVIGPAAHHGYRRAWKAGLGAAFVAYVWIVIIATLHALYKGMSYHAYKTVDDLVDGFFKVSMDYASLIFNWQILVAALFGGLLAATFAGMAGRLWD